MLNVLTHPHVAMRMGNAWGLCHPRHAVLVVDSALAPLHRVTGTGKPCRLRGHVRRRGSIGIVKASATACASSSSAAAPGPARDHNLLRDTDGLHRLLGAGLTLCLFGFALLARHPLL